MTLDELKQREEIAKLRVERLKAAGGLAVAASSAAGLIGIFFYCFVFIGFLPAGLNVSDTFFFVFAMLAFSVAGGLAGLFGLLAYTPYMLKKPVNASAGPMPLPHVTVRDNNGAISLLVMTALGAVTAHYLVKAANYGKGLNDMSDWLCLALFVALSLAHLRISFLLVQGILETLLSTLVWLVFTGFSGLLTMRIAAASGGGAEALEIIAIVLMSGLCLAFGFTSLDDPPAAISPPSTAAPSTPKYRIAGIFLCIGVLVPYIPAITAAPIVNAVMQGLGLRANSATLLVNTANFAALEAAANANGFFLYACKENSDTYAVSGVRVLWHGIGQRSYIELHSPTRPPLTPSPAVRIELDSAGIKKSNAATAASCAELKRGVYFDSNSPTLAAPQWAITLPFIQSFFSAAKWSNSQVVVIGYADPMQPSSKSNFKLAQERACDVAKKLVDQPLSSKETTWIDVRLDSDLASKCKDLKDASQQRACFETDRRVEVQLVQPSGRFLRVGAAKAMYACPGFAALAPAKR